MIAFRPDRYQRFVPLPEDRRPGSGAWVRNRLGRHVLHDQRSRDFPAETAREITDVEHKGVGLPLNQGQIGKCTCEAFAGAKNSAPNYHAGDHVLNDHDTTQLYEWETALEGEPYPQFDPGGTGLMVCRAAKAHGVGGITSYRHAFGLEHALLALVLRPQLWGVLWYDSFDTVDPQTGVLELPAGAKPRGGHEFVAVEIRKADELIGCEQSWGPWGLRGSGRFYLPFAVAERLLEQQGDVTVPHFG